MAEHSKLPFNVLVKIMSFLSIHDKFQLMPVSKEWMMAIDESLLQEKSLYLKSLKYLRSSSFRTKPSKRCRIIHDYRDISFWTNIFKKMPNLENIYFEAIYIDLHREDRPNPQIIEEFELLGVLFENVPKVKKLFAHQLEEWPFVSPSLEVLSVFSIEDSAMRSLIESMTPIKEIKGYVAMNDWTSLPAGMTRCGSISEHLNEVAASPAAPTIEFLGHLYIRSSSDIPTDSKFPSLKELDVLICHEADVDETLKRLSSLVPVVPGGSNPGIKSLTLTWESEAKDETWRSFFSSSSFTSLQLVYLVPRKNELFDASLLALFCPNLKEFIVQISNGFYSDKTFSDIAKIRSLEWIHLTITEVNVIPGQHIISFIMNLFDRSRDQERASNITPTVFIRTYFYGAEGVGIRFSVEEQNVLNYFMKQQGIKMLIAFNLADRRRSMTILPKKPFKELLVRGILVESKKRVKRVNLSHIPIYRY